MAYITGNRNYWERFLWGLLPFIIIIIVWFILTFGKNPEDRILSPIILPSPQEVVKSIPSLWFDRELTRNALWSLERVFLGFIFAAIVAVPLGVTMAAFGQVRALGEPLTAVTSYLPIAALVPLTMSWFGMEETQKIAFLALATFIYLAPLSFNSAMKVDQVYINTAYTLGANKWHVLRRVLFMISAGDLFDNLRMAFGVGWTYIILAEMVNLGNGLGSLILISERRGPREHIYLVLLSIILIAFVIDYIWKMIGNAIFPYRNLKR